MNITKQQLSAVPQFSDRDKAYIQEIADLRSFYKYPVQLDSFHQIIQDKQKDNTDRALLHQTLVQQYSTLDTSAKVIEHINMLADEKTFTIVTAHQPSLMTGPGYYFYKIFSVLNLVDQLKNKYNNYQFVPIFITGGEDHDFEEINHFTLYGKSFEWHSDQKGSVGNFSLDEGFDTMFDSFLKVVGDGEQVQSFKKSLASIKSSAKNYADFAVKLTNHLFQEFGLVVVDMSHKAFKNAFIPIIKKEVFDQVSIGHVEATQKELEAKKLKTQAMARPINFFYTGSGDRLRINQDGDGFSIVDSDITFIKAALEQEIETHPEHFSPNVVMRPIFQEFILPNLAYIGGGGEIAYWLERLTQFEQFGLNFPMLIRRNSGMIIDKGSQKKLSKLNIEIDDIFGDTDVVIAQYLAAVAGDNLAFDKEIANIEVIFQSIAEKAKAVDPTLEAKMLAEGTKIAKQVDQLTSRVTRAAKQNEETAVNQISKIKDKLFPGMGLQERKACFLEEYLKHGNSIISELIPHFDPLAKTMIIVEV